MKPKVAFFELTSCEGCQLQIVNLEDEIVSVSGLVDIVNFREAISDKGDSFDIVFIEGCVSRPKDEKKLKELRDKAKYVVAMGACACIGGINCMKNFQNLDEVRKAVYGEKARLFETAEAKPISEYVKVDFFIPGCPIHKGEFLEVVKSLLQGKNPLIPDHPVCMECKLAENECVFDKGLVCMGSVSRAGCGAWCPSNGNACEGCRGIAKDANAISLRQVMQEHNISSDEALSKFRLFAGYSEVSKK